MIVGEALLVKLLNNLHQPPEVTTPSLAHGQSSHLWVPVTVPTPAPHKCCVPSPHGTFLEALHVASPSPSSQPVVWLISSPTSYWDPLAHLLGTLAHTLFAHLNSGPAVDSLGTASGFPPPAPSPLCLKTLFSYKRVQLAKQNRP